MNSIPMISHRLFMAAAGQAPRVARRATRSAGKSWPESAPALTLALDLVDGGKPMADASRILDPRSLLGRWPSKGVYWQTAR